MRLLVAFALLVCLGSGLAEAQRKTPPPPPSDPVLRIEPGMHTGVIKRIAVDQTCSLMASGSDDKTVRLWRIKGVKKPELLRTVRAPIGPGNDGKIYAVAMSPDGTWIAAGGWDAAYAAEGGNYIYIFETATGRQMGRLGPFSNVINHLTVSPDGRWLAAALFGGYGAAIWDTKSGDPSRWRLVGRDEAYDGKDSYGSAFDRQGRLFTIAYDGKIRRYGPPTQYADGTLKPERIALTPGGQRPFSVDVHPNGKFVAVGHDEVPNVDVFDAETLTAVHAADSKGILNGDVSKVVWTHDGRRLLAGGRFSTTGQIPLRIWDVGLPGRLGPGRNVMIGTTDTIMQLTRCGDGVAFGSQDPAVGLIGADGSPRLWQGTTKPDMRGTNHPNFYVSTDGSRVFLRLAGATRDPVLFDLAAERLAEMTERPADLAESDITSLAVTDWYDRVGTKVDGKSLQLERDEMSRSLAIAPDKSRFVLGTEWRLRMYKSDGTAVWDWPTPGVTWGVNVSRDGRFAIAAYGDGTVRWHRLSDGREVLALFVHMPVDRTAEMRWIAWTPKGYYLASPGAEELIGWHVNRGWDRAPDFFPVGQFREQFNRPDIVKAVLRTIDEEKAIIEANLTAKQRRADEDIRKNAPPMLWIERPDDQGVFNTNEVTFHVRAMSPSGQRITGIDYRINNLALASRAAIPREAGDGSVLKLTLPMPTEDVNVTFVARDGSRTSEPVSVRLRWDGAKPGQVKLPRLRAVFIGTNAYSAPTLPPLNLSVKDAKDLAAFFKAQEGRTYSKVDARIVADGDRGEVIDALEWLEKSSEEGDINMLFLSGHGVTDEKGVYYYMGRDGDADRPRATGVGRDQILETIRNRRGAMVVMLDTCHSGATGGGVTTMPTSRVDMNRLANELGDKTLGVLLYASTTARLLSYENMAWGKGGNGAFTAALLEGLAGKADRENVGYVDSEELSLYVRRRVKDLTKGLQEPVRMKPDAASEMKLVVLK